MTPLSSRLTLILLGGFALSACGGNAAATPQATATHVVPPATAPAIPTDTPPAPTVQPAPSATAIAPTPTIAATATAAATPRPTTAKPVLLYASLRPDTVATGGTITASVNTRGAVQRVEMYLSTGPGGPSPLTFQLTQTTPGGWTGSFKAPAAPAQYHFTVGLYGASNRRTIIDHDGFNINVAGGAGPPTARPAVQPLPADIPLVPPFSYSVPETAVFSAEGKTVTGSEVISNARPDVSTTSVAQFYEVHLPRAGWTVDASTVPPVGAGSFVIAGTSGPRVCVVSYASGIVHIFYGTLPAG